MRYHCWWYCVLLIVFLFVTKNQEIPFILSSTQLSVWLVHNENYMPTGLIRFATNDCAMSIAYRRSTFTWHRFHWHFIIINIVIVILNLNGTWKKSESQMEFEPRTLCDLVRCSNHWATGDSMVSKGQFVGLDWNRITRLHHVATQPSNGLPYI